MDTASTTLLCTMLEQIKNPMRYLFFLLFRNVHVGEVLRELAEGIFCFTSSLKVTILYVFPQPKVYNCR